MKLVIAEKESVEIVTGNYQRSNAILMRTPEVGILFKLKQENIKFSSDPFTSS